MVGMEETVQFPPETLGERLINAFTGQTDRTEEFLEYCHT